MQTDSNINQEQFQSTPRESPDQSDDIKQKVDLQKSRQHQVIFKQPNWDFNPYKISPFFREYIQIFKRGRQIRPINQFVLQMNQQKIKYLTGLKIPYRFNYNKMVHSRNYKIIQLQISMSKFIIELKILNLTYNDGIKINLEHRINEGSFGCVYSVQKDNTKYAVKQIPLGSQITTVIQNTIKQYCFMKICSTLQIGPAVNRLFGFDLITTQKSILFSCQKGISYFDFLNKCKQKAEFQTQFQKLEEGLLLMHNYSMTHNDIKPDNIIYSPTYKKLVFIDFGLSQQNLQCLGYMKVQKAKGSLKYCSEQMKAIFLCENKQDFVDIYYNDYIALKKTKQTLQSELYLKLGDNKREQEFFESYQNGNRFCFVSQRFQVLNTQKQAKLVHSQMVDKLNVDDHYFQVFQLIYLISERNVAQVINLFQKNKQIVYIIAQNFKTICFVFLQMEISSVLYKIYNSIVSMLNDYQVTLSYQIKQIIQKWIQPYFKVFRDSKHFNQKNEVIQRYNVASKYQLEAIKRRFQSQTFFINEIKSRNYQNYHHQNAQDIQSNQLIIISDVSQIKDYSKIIFQGLQNLQYPELLLICLERIGNQLQHSFKLYDITRQKISTFQQICLKLGFRISLNVSEEFQRKKYINLLSIYAKVLTQIFILLVQKFQPSFIIGHHVCNIYKKNKNFNKQFHQILQNLYFLPILLSEQEDQVQKIINKISFIQLVEYFDIYQEINFRIFQKTLNVLDQLKIIINLNCDFQDSFNINKVIICILQKKINQSIYAKIFTDNGQLTRAVALLSDYMALYCFQFRQIFIKQCMLICEESYEVFGFVQYTKKYCQIVNFRELKCSSYVISKKQEYLAQVSATMSKINQQYKRNPQIQKQFYQAIAATLIIGQRLYQQLGVTAKFYQLFKKITDIKSTMEDSQILKLYALQKILRFSIEFDNLQKSIDLFLQFQINKKSIRQLNLYSLALYFYQRINNSKMIKKTKQKLASQMHTSITLRQVNNVFCMKKSGNVNLNYGQTQNINITQDKIKMMSSHEIEKQDLQANNNNKQLKYLQFFQKSWIQASNQQIQDKHTKFRLKNFRKVIHDICYSPAYEKIIGIFVMRYNVELQKFLQEIKNKFDKVRQIDELFYQIPDFLGFKQHDKFWKYAQKLSIYYPKIQLLFEMCYNFHSDQADMFVLRNQWNRIDQMTKSQFKGEQNIIPITFYVTQCKYYQNLMKNKKAEQSYESRKQLYQQSIKKYFLKVHQRRQDEGEYLGQQSQNSSQTMSQIRHIQKMNSTNKQLHLKILLDIYEGVVTIDQSLVFRYQTSSVMSQKSTIQKVEFEFINIFFQMAQSNQFNKVFIWNTSYVKWLWLLIKFSIRDIFMNIKVSQVQLKQIFQNLPFYQMTYILVKLLKFYNIIPCSSYSSFILAIFKQIKEKIIYQLQNNKKQLQINQKLTLIENFQKQIQSICLNQQHLTETIILIFQLQQIKWYNIIDVFLKNSQKTEKVSTFHSQIQQMIKIKKQKTQDQLLKIGIKIQKLEFLMKQYFKNQIYKLLMNLNQTFRIFQLNQTVMVSQERQKVINSHTGKFYQVKYIRNSKRMNKVNYTKEKCLNFYNYYDSFTPIDINLVKRIISRRVKQSDDNYYWSKLCDSSRIKIFRLFQQKIDTFIHRLQ